MLDPKYMRDAPKEFLEKFENIENELIDKLTAKMALTGEIDEHKLYLLMEFSSTEVINDLLELSGEINDKIYKAALDTLKDDSKRSGVRLEYDSAINLITTGIQLSTAGTFSNLTQSLALGKRGTPIEQYLDQNFLSVAIGAEDISTVIRRTVRDICNDGLMFIDYGSGARRSVESVVRSTIVTGLSNLSSEIGLLNAQTLNSDLMEISAHAGARPDHAKWQGKIVSLSGAAGYLSLDDIGYNTVTGFGGANCRHSWFVIFNPEDRVYTDKELSKINNKMVTVNNSDIPLWKAIEKQRYLERNIRKTKRLIRGFEGVEDKVELDKLKFKLKNQLQDYSSYSESINQIVDRMRIFI